MATLKFNKHTNRVIKIEVRLFKTPINSDSTLKRRVRELSSFLEGIRINDEFEMYHTIRI